MAARDLDAVFYSEDVPEIAYRGGTFHVSYRIRKCYFEFVMPPDVFNKAMLLAEGARAQWQLALLGGKRDNVTAFGKKR